MIRENATGGQIFATLKGRQQPDARRVNVSRSICLCKHR